VKIIGIGTNFEHDIIQRIDFFSEITFLDADIIILDHKSIRYEIGLRLRTYDTVKMLEKGMFEYIKVTIDKRKDELTEFFSLDRTLFVFNPVLETTRYKIYDETKKEIYFDIDLAKMIFFDSKKFKTKKEAGSNIQSQNPDFEDLITSGLFYYENSYIKYDGVPVYQISGTSHVMLLEFINNLIQVT
jgi:hypothetical protein